MSIPNPIVLDMDITEPQSIPMTVAVSDTTIGMAVGTAINVGGAGRLQDKAVSYSPSTATQTDTVTPDEDYDALREVAVTVAAMPVGTAKTPTTNVEENPTISVDGNGLVTASYTKTKAITPAVTAGYVTSGTSGNVTFSGSSSYQLPIKTASDLTTSGSAVTTSPGFYPSAVSKAVASGIATTPATTISATPTISVNSTGKITASVSTSSSVTPNVTAGWVENGTAGTVSVTGSNSQQLTTVSGSTIAPTEASQLAVPPGRYTTGSIYFGAIPSTYVGSGVPTMSAADLTVSGSIVTAPSGIYSSAVSASVASGYRGATTITAGQTASTKTYKVEHQAATSGWYEAASVRNDGTVILNYQSVTATPNSTTQTFTPTNSLSYISQVTVNPIPSEYIVPSGTLSITSNASGVDVSTYAFADVTVPFPLPSLESKSITLTPSTASVSSSVTAGAGYDGLSEVDITVDAVPTGSVQAKLTMVRSSNKITFNPTASVSQSGYIVASSYSGSATALNILHTTAFYPSTTIQVAGSQDMVLEGAINVFPVTTTNIEASYIASGVTVKVGTTNDDDSIAAVTGTLTPGITPSGTITLLGNTTGVDIGEYAFADVAVPWTWMGEEPTVVNSSFYSDSYLLGSTSYSSWTGSTTAKAIVASKAAGTFVASSMNTYEYLINWQMDVAVTLKSTATKKAIPIRETANVYQLVTRRPNSTANITNDNFNGNTAYTFFTAPYLQYWNTSGTSTYTWSNSYGFYGTVQTPTFSNSTADSPTVTIKTPIWYARCSASYFATGRVGDVDQTATTLKRTCKIYRVKKGTAPREVYEGLVDLINNPL